MRDFKSCAIDARELREKQETQSNLVEEIEMPDKPYTQIGTPTSDTERFLMRGRDVLTEVLGEKSFSETFLTANGSLITLTFLEIWLSKNVVYK